VSLNLKDKGASAAPEFKFGVLSITADDGVAPALVQLLNLNGISVVGGSSNFATDGAEALHFRFETAVTNVRYAVFVAGNLDGDAFVGESFIEAFIGTTSLGVVAVNDTGWKNVSALFGGVAITGFDVLADVDAQRIDQVEYTNNWDDLGQSLAGTHGIPELVGKGALIGGLPASVTLQGALENSVTVFVIGTAAVNLPLLGGTLVPAFEPPFGAYLVQTTSGTGQASLATTWPSGQPSGKRYYFQCWTHDPGAPQGFSASNAVRGTTP
jgi:hypothetical protein